MTNEKLITLAASVLHPVMVGDRLFGDVGCALVSESGKVYQGVCMDTAGTGICAEPAAISAMVTAQEYRINTIVAVWKDKEGRVHVIHPCGKCREFMRQIDIQNMETDVILGADRVVKLKELLPYTNDFSLVEGV